MFGAPNTPQNLTFADGNKGWSFNDGKKGTYVFFRRESDKTVEDEKVETLMVALRTARGVDEEVLQANCIPGSIEQLMEEGALVKVGRRYRIPEDHFFVSDQIIRTLI